MISVSWKCHVWEKRIIWAKHTRQNQNHATEKESWKKKKKNLFRNWRPSPFWEGYLCVRFPLSSTFSDQLQGSIWLSCPFSWRKIEPAFSLWKASPFTFAQRTVSAGGPLLWALCVSAVIEATLVQSCLAMLLLLWIANTAPSSLLWGMDYTGEKDEKRGLRRRRNKQACLRQF